MSASRGAWKSIQRATESQRGTCELDARRATRTFILEPARAKRQSERSAGHEPLFCTVADRRIFQSSVQLVAKESERASQLLVGGPHDGAGTVEGAVSASRDGTAAIKGEL